MKITKRKEQLLDLLVEGRTNKEMAEALQISEHTVKVHFWRMFQKIGAKNRGSAAAWWINERHPAGETREQIFALGVAEGHRQILSGITLMAEQQKELS